MQTGIGFFFVREFVKMIKIVCEFAKTISFVIREKKKYCSQLREKLKNLFVNSSVPAYLLIVVRKLTKSRSWNRETCHFSLVR